MEPMESLKKFEGERRKINRPHYKDLLERCEREKEWLMKRVEELGHKPKPWWRFWE